MTPLLLATTSIVDEIDPSLLFLALASFAVSGLLAVVAAGLLLFSPTKSALGQRLSLSGLMFGLTQLILSAYVHVLGFVPVEQDGTPASPPLWLALLVPSLPFVVNTALFLAHRQRLKSPASAQG